MKFFVIGIMSLAYIGALMGFAVLMETYPWIPILIFVTPIAVGAAWVLYDKFVLGVKSPPWP